MQNCKMTLKLFYSSQEVLFNENKIQIDLMWTEITFINLYLYIEYTEIK